MIKVDLEWEPFGQTVTNRKKTDLGHISIRFEHAKPTHFRRFPGTHGLFQIQVYTFEERHGVRLRRGFCCPSLLADRGCLRTAYNACSTKLRPEADTRSRCAVAGISSQPASSKNHERRSSFTKSACADENMSIGIVSSPTNALPQYHAGARRRPVAQSDISTSAERTGRRIFTQRNAPSHHVPKQKVLAQQRGMLSPEA